MNKLSLVALVGVLFFVLGGALGVFYQMQKDAPQLATIGALSSSIIPSIVAYGEVSAVEGRNLTLTFNNENLTVPVAQNAQIYSFAQGSGQTGASQQQASFSQIKKGDYINISVKLFEDGKLEGVTVIILPPVSTPQ